MLAYDPDEPGAILLDDALAAWTEVAAVSLDWLFLGDPKGMAISFRRELLSEREFITRHRLLDDDQKRLFKGALIAIVNGNIEAEDVMNAYQAGLAELQAKKAAEAA